MKNFTLIMALFMFIGINQSQAQYTYEGTTLPAKLNFESQSLLLNGGGLREKYFLDLYVGGLYLEAKSKNANEIIAADKPMAIRLHIISGLIDSEKMTDAIDEGMEKSTNGKQSQFSNEINEMKKTFAEQIKVGDIYDFVYLPGQGVVIYKNNKKANTIKGLEFKKALFGIWLCDDPADDDLKEGMLKG